VTAEGLNCDEFVELVTAYVEDALDDRARRRAEDHLATCIGCERYLDQIRRTVADLGRMPAEQLSDQARDDLLAAFRGWHPER
jgi:anti-sigma factor RsiW